MRYRDLHYAIASNVLVERFIQDPLKTYFSKQHPSGACKNHNIPLYNFDYDSTIPNRKGFRPTATGNIRDENRTFEADTEPIQCYFQILLSLKVSISHQIHRCQTNATSKLNGNINKYVNESAKP